MCTGPSKTTSFIHSIPKPTSGEGLDSLIYFWSQTISREQSRLMPDKSSMKAKAQTIPPHGTQHTPINWFFTLVPFYQSAGWYTSFSPRAETWRSSNTLNRQSLQTYLNRSGQTALGLSLSDLRAWLQWTMLMCTMSLTVSSALMPFWALWWPILVIIDTIYWTVTSLILNIGFGFVYTVIGFTYFICGHLLLINQR